MSYDPKQWNFDYHDHHMEEESTDASGEETPEQAAPSEILPGVPTGFTAEVEDAAAQDGQDARGAQEESSGSAAPHSAESSHAEGEYRFIPERKSGYSDAGYTPAADAGAMPKSYHCAAAPERGTKKSRRGARAAGLVAACLVSAILGGIGGGALAPKLLRGQEDTAMTETVLSESAAEPALETAGRNVLSVSAPAATPQVTTTAVTPGTELTATQIYYDLAVHQAVGITTEITYTNVWGYSSSGAVKGSGFILSEDGYIMTNYHVIEDAVKGGYDIQVLDHDGKKYIAEVVGYAEDNDVAVLKIDATGLSPVVLGDSNNVRVGERVYAVGNPLGELEYSISDGIVSALDRDMKNTEKGRSTTINMFQITAAINSGNSGGPIYNSRGEVIGIATAKYASSGVEGLGFAIPISDAVAIANDLITDGYVRGKARIGILNASTLSASSAQYYGIVPGVYFEGIDPGSAAEKAGLQVGDIIVGLGDKEITDFSSLTTALKSFHAGDTTTLKVYRNSSYVTLTITLDEAKPDTGATQKQNSQDGQQEEQQDGQNARDGSRQQLPVDPYDYFYDFFSGNPFGR